MISGVDFFSQLWYNKKMFSSSQIQIRGPKIDIRPTNDTNLVAYVDKAGNQVVASGSVLLAGLMLIASNKGITLEQVLAQGRDEAIKFFGPEPEPEGEELVVEGGPKHD